MKTFHATRNIKLTYSGLLLLMLIGFGILGYMPFRLFSALSDLGNGTGNTADSLSLILSPICSIPLLFFLFILVWMGVTVVAVYKTRLNFDEQTIKLESLRHFTFFLWGSALMPFTIPYDQIRTIRSNGLAGTVQILAINGKKYTLAPSIFGKNYGEEVLVELQNHLPAERIESGMEIPEMLRKWAKGNKARIVFILSFMVVYLGTFLVDPMFSSRSWFVRAWNVEQRLPLFENIWTYSVISGNESWFVSDKFDSYRVYHFASNKVTNTWDMPETPSGIYPDFVSDDGNGNPVVWFETHASHYNSAWKDIEYQNGLDLGQWYSSSFVSGRQGWAILKNEGMDTQLLYIDGLTGEWSAIPFPDTAIQQKLSPQTIRQALNGEILVLMTNNINARVYLLSKNTWKSTEFPVILIEDSDVEGFFLDENNFLWVLFSFENEWFAEKINERGELQITKLKSPKGEYGWERYNDLYIDVYGRIWVTGSNFIAVVRPVWKGDAEEIVRYTEDNSNYQGTRLYPHVMSPDGRIWTFDRKITTIDTRLETLPTPLPAWFAGLDWNLIRLFVILAQLLFSIYLLVALLVRFKPQKKKAPK